MDYTIQDGKFYKIIENNEIVSFGELTEGMILSTNSEVVFIEQDEYFTLKSEIA